MKRILVALVVFAACLQNGSAQRKSLNDSIYRLPITGLQLEGQIPAGDLAARFGPSLSVGIPVLYKTQRNFIFGVEGNYFFGAKVKEQIMSNLLTPDGTITDVNGNPGAFRLNERGWNVYLEVGKVFQKLGHNPNSGLMVMAGAGYFTHKINIYVLGKNIPQLAGDMRKGYDRLSGGPALNQFIGYLFMSQNRITNFYAGFEFQEAFTTGLRSYQFDLMGPDNQKRLDILCGLRFGWMLPIYKKAPKEFYYY
jgi:hypothetical protein